MAPGRHKSGNKTRVPEEPAPHPITEEEGAEKYEGVRETPQRDGRVRGGVPPHVRHRSGERCVYQYAMAVP